MQCAQGAPALRLHRADLHAGQGDRVGLHAALCAAVARHRVSTSRELRVDYPNGGQMPHLRRGQSRQPARHVSSTASCSTSTACTRRRRSARSSARRSSTAAAVRCSSARRTARTSSTTSRSMRKREQAQGHEGLVLCRIQSLARPACSTRAYLEAARAVMTSDEYAQEFECSFEATVKGAIYAKELEAARRDTPHHRRAGRPDAARSTPTGTSASAMRCASGSARPSRARARCG